MGLLTILRKLGIVQVGGKTYKGKNVGGDYSTADLDTTRGKQPTSDGDSEESK